jgi:cysteine desulfurase / selenocysteine lyase
MPLKTMYNYPMDIEKIREQFPILKKEVNGNPLVYLDNAATTQKPLVMLEETQKYYMETNANVHRGIHTLSYESTKAWEGAHEKIAQFLNAESADEIIFTKNATESLNLFANTYGRQFLKEGDVIVISEMEHHSNIVPWQELARERKLKLEWIPVLENFKLDLNYLDYLLRKYKERLKILSIVHVSNVLGTVNDVSLLAKKIHSVGGVFCLDASQSVPHMEVDVQKLDCDFLAFSGHKAYGPMGVGVLYGKKKLLEKMNPWIMGGDMVNKVTKNGARWAELPEKFEAGTPNVAGAVGLVASIDWLKSQGWEEILDREKKLTQIVLAGLSTICGLEFLGSTSTKDRVGVISFKVEDMHPHDIATLLDEKGIAVRTGFHCCEPLHERYSFEPSVRVSFGIYNTQEEAKYFVNSFKSILNKFL